MARPATDRILVNRYALKTPLGRGGMGVVWRAHDVVLGREVAVKEVAFPPGMPDAERHSAQARVTREARAAARLNHQGVVALYDVVTHHGGVFIVMELVVARTLAELIQVEGPLAPERVAEIGAQLASALEAAHQAGIVHRDVKPANVLVTQAGAAKLTDFGVASLSGDPRLTTTGMVIGSPAYMAPEQAQGEPTGPPADFWALGATLYFAVEGQPPFDKGASMATLAAAPTTPTTAAQRGLPASWRPFTNRAGSNRVGVPPGFRARTRQSYNATVVEEKGGARRVFTVRSQNPSAPLPQASRDYRAWARRNFAGFREVRYAENQTYAGRTGAVVFEYRAVRDGRQVHVRHVNVKGRTWGYNVELIVPAGQWDDSQGLARQFEQAFRPLG
jgi:serine/threonine protein kinase